MTIKIAQLTSRSVIGVSGPDWRSFLQGLITQDVETLAPGEIRYGALLTPQGRLLNDLFVSGDDEGCTLDVAAAAAEGLIQKLSLYRLRAKVRISSLDAKPLAAWGGPPPCDAFSWMIDPRRPDLGYRAYGLTGADRPVGDEAAYDLHRLSLGVPDPAKDCIESDYPLEANFDVLNGVDFKKGCFVGQETTSRMHRRGVVKTRMAPVVFRGPPPRFGAEILSDGRRAGEVRSGVEGRAMALLRIDRVGGPALTVDDRPVALELAPWLSALFHQTVDETP